MGFKKTSDTIAISFGLEESVADTYTEEEIALQLDVLNNEIFVVLAVDLNPAAPLLVAGTNTEVRAVVASTSAPTMRSLASSNVIAEASQAIRSNGGEAVSFTRAAEESFSGSLDYIALISTNNFFLSILGTNTGKTNSVNGRIWGYRARADASTYAALVQSEVLSA